MKTLFLAGPEDGNWLDVHPDAWDIHIPGRPDPGLGWSSEPRVVDYRRVRVGAFGKRGAVFVPSLRMGPGLNDLLASKLLSPLAKQVLDGEAR